MTATQLQALRDWVKAEIAYATHELKYPTDSRIHEQYMAGWMFHQLELAFKEGNDGHV